MKILIAGDSFAAKWPNCNTGWVNLLEHDFDVTNVAQAGVGEYKILKQLESVNPNLFDVVIVSHTSPSRIHTPSHPIHKDGFHKDCDLIFTDLECRNDWCDPSLKVAKGLFVHHYDDQYQLDIYKLIRVPYISMSHIDMLKTFSLEKEFINFSQLWNLERGDINHYSNIGNDTIYKVIKEKIEKYE